MEVVTPMPFVSVVMPNWNGKDDTLECLDSLHNLNYPKDRMEIIIVDNGSKDGSIEVIRKKYQEMKYDCYWRLMLLENRNNLGAPAAYNRGIKSANPDYNYIFKIDNDVVFNREYLKELVKIAEEDEKIGIVGGKILYYYKPGIICSTGNKLNLWIMQGKCRHYNKREDEFVDETIEDFDDIPACAVIIKKILFESIGLFDELYFVYTDDADFCIRSKKAGFRNVYNPLAKAWHKIGNTTNKISGFGIYHIMRNRIIFQRKHTNCLQYVWFNIYTWFYLYPRNLLGLVIKGNSMLIRPFLKGIEDGYLERIHRF